MPTPAILHVDMDAFFASVAQLDHPELAGKPVIVGGHSTQRGVVASASYEARAHGVHSAMPIAQAIALCPHAICVPVAMGRYRQVNRQVRQIWDRFAPVVETAGLDEAYLDITGTEALLGPPKKVESDLRAAILAETNLSASVGGGTSKLVAKMASRACKPAGVLWIEPGTERQWLLGHDVALMPGIGPVTQKRLRAMGVDTIGDLAGFPTDILASRFGVHGVELQAAACGRDTRAVTPAGLAKSISAEETFDADSSDRDFLHRRVLDLSCDVGYRLRQAGLVAATITAKVRLGRGFETIERSVTLPAATQDDDTICRAAWDRVISAWDRSDAVRLLGVRASKLRPSLQLSLFDPAGGPAGQESRPVDGIPRSLPAGLNEVLDAVRERFGYEAITRGALLKEPRRQSISGD